MTYKGITFNGTHSTANKLEYWCNFIQTKYWLADRLLVLCKVTNPTASEGLYVTGQSDSPFGMVKYELDANGYCVIDFTDFYRTYRGAREIWLWYGVEDYDDPSVNLVTLFDDPPLGLINPAGVYIPKHPLEDYGAIIVPPARMLYDVTMNVPLIFEFRGDGLTQWSIYEMDAAGIDLYDGTLTEPSHALDDTTVVAFNIYDPGFHSWRMQEAPCDAELAFVEWISFTGATRRHIFEVQKHKTDTGDSFSVLSLDGQPFQIKGRKDGFTLRLDNLCAYDVWYYADVITSSDVNVSLDGGATWARVEVTSKNITLPNEDATDGKVEISVNWKEYDPITLQ